MAYFLTPYNRYVTRKRSSKQICFIFNYFVPFYFHNPHPNFPEFIKDNITHSKTVENPNENTIFIQMKIRKNNEKEIKKRINSLVVNNQIFS